MFSLEVKYTDTMINIFFLILVVDLNVCRCFFKKETFSHLFYCYVMEQMTESSALAYSFLDLQHMQKVLSEG